MTVASYNFCKPGRLASDRENRFAGWLRAACALATRNWTKRLPFTLEWTFQGFDTLKSQDGLAQLPDAVVAYRLEMAGGTVTTLLAMPRPLVLALAGTLVGDTGTAMPPDRELTPVEEALFELFVNNFLFPAMHETWPGQEAALLKLGLAEPHPKWSRAFAPEAPLVRCDFILSGPFGLEQWFWILPREGLLVLLDQPGQAAADTAAEAANAKPRLEELVNNLPVEITVVLGSVELRLSQLSSLRAGDVVVLNQRVSELVSAFVADERKFRGWPGRAGSCQAFQVESLINR